MFKKGGADIGRLRAMWTSYFLPPKAPHLAFAPPHFPMLPCFAPQAPHNMAQPLSAAAVTTAEANTFDNEADMVFIRSLLAG